MPDPAPADDAHLHRDARDPALLRFRQLAAGQGGGIIEATITSNGPAPGGALTIKFSHITRNKAAAGGGIFAVPGSPVTLKVTVIARNIPDNCAPPGAVPGCHG